MVDGDIGGRGGVGWGLETQAIFRIIGVGVACLALTVPPLAPTPTLHYIYALKLVLKVSPFLVHRTDCPTTICNTLYLHVPSSCGHPISDILFIKKYPEMGCRYYRIFSSCILLISRLLQQITQKFLFNISA